MSDCSCVVSGHHLLGSHADSFPSQMMHLLHPSLEFLDILSGAKGASGGRQNRRSAGRRKSHPKSIWVGNSRWSRGRHSCRQAGKKQFLVPVLLITGYQEREAVQDDLIEPLYHAVSE
ncbi:hypothetical protein TNCV_1879901 [Trichonephila clavipes]|nr:hypothetical protein TNCV_1879901 [Trichonephila clavipes]